MITTPFFSTALSEQSCAKLILLTIDSLFKYSSIKPAKNVSPAPDKSDTSACL